MSGEAGRQGAAKVAWPDRTALSNNEGASAEDPMARNRFTCTCGTLSLVLMVILLLPPAAYAQDVDEEYILYHLGPAAEEMQWAGVDGSADSSPAIIEIAQRWWIEPAFWVSVDEARMLVSSGREDGEVRGRMGSLRDPSEAYPSRVTLARFGVMRVALTCAQAQEKARSAQRLADTLSRVSQLNGVGTGLVGALSQGAARFAGPMAFATAVTGFASAWAGQLASAYRNAPCLAGGQQWRFRPNVLKTTALLPQPFPGPSSSRGRRGSAFAPSHTGCISRPRDRAFQSCSLSVSGALRSS
jgi:hypothetical protein